uniref:Uncharacterized protein n=1 Tax=Alexandrium monilatum TaxID=311494 RepID=A0A7S4V4C3_9DINO
MLEGLSPKLRLEALLPNMDALASRAAMFSDVSIAAKSYGAAALESEEDEEAPLARRSRPSPDPDAARLSNDDELALSVPRETGGGEAPASPFSRRPPCWRVLLASSFLFLGLASYAAAMYGSAGAASSSPGGPPRTASASLGLGTSAVQVPAPAPRAAPPRAPRPGGSAESAGEGAAPGSAGALGGGLSVPGAPGRDGPSLLCFAWTPRRPHDEEMLPEVRRQLRGCDARVFFTDEDAAGAPSADIVPVRVSPQEVQRSDRSWLDRRDMAGLIPSWSRLLESGAAELYDWVVNVELDHFVSPARIRSGIKAYLDVLRSGDQTDQGSVDGPLMLMWGSAFLFNRKLVLAMKRRWHELSRSGNATSAASGCPLFMQSQPEWPKSCAQDVAYPALAGHVMLVPWYGASDCGQPDSKNRRGQRFPPACWEMHRSPFSQTEEGQMRVIREMAAVQNMSEKDVQEYYRGTQLESSWRLFYDARQVPVIHHVAFPSVLRLAAELLRA